MITKVEGRGNGIKTNIVNMVDVAKALARPPAYITKFFGCELGAQSRFDDKSDTAIVNGSHDSVKLAALLEVFIKKYVQCYGCGNTETEISISKSQMISLKCAACGFVSDVDMRDKLTTFILKNPPEQKKDKKGMRRAEKERLREGEVMDEENKKGRKESKPKKGHDGTNGHASKKVSDHDVEVISPASSLKDDTEDEDEAGEDDVEWQTDTSASAAQQRMKEQLTAATTELVMLDNAVAADVDEKKSKQTKKIAAGEATNPPQLPAKSPDVYKRLVEKFRKYLDDGLVSKQLVEQFHSAQPLVSDKEAMHAYFEALFQGTSRGLAKEIDRKKLFLSQAVTTDHAQGLLLQAVEAFCSSGSVELQKEIPLALKKLYDLDIVEEDAILAWYDDKTSLDCISVKKFAKPFVEWLQSAESEEDE
jgi:translation initiation factor 5